jgi:hypothetical protein
VLSRPTWAAISFASWSTASIAMSRISKGAVQDRRDARLQLFVPGRVVPGEDAVHRELLDHGYVSRFSVPLK